VYQRIKKGANHYKLLIDTMKEEHLFLLTFQDLKKRKCKKLFNHINKLEIDTTSILTKWFSKFFIGSLPYHVALWVFSCTLMEGNKILYRTALALLKANQDKLLTTSSKKGFLETLESITKTTIISTLQKGFENLFIQGSCR